MTINQYTRAFSWHPTIERNRSCECGGLHPSGAHAQMWSNGRRHLLGLCVIETNRDPRDFSPAISGLFSVFVMFVVRTAAIVLHRVIRPALMWAFMILCTPYQPNSDQTNLYQTNSVHSFFLGTIPWTLYTSSNPNLSPRSSGLAPPPAGAQMTISRKYTQRQ